MRSIWARAAFGRPYRATSVLSVSRETLNRTHDQPAVGLVALTVRLHVGALAQIRMHDLALHRAHRLELHGPLVLQRLRGRPVGHAVQGSRPALAVPGGVHRHLLAVLGAPER